MQANPEKIKYTWDEIDALCFDLVCQIKKFKFKPDYVVCIMTGGMIPSRIIADKLNVKEILPLHITSYNKNNQQKNLIIRDFNYTFIKGKKVLIVDELIDGGRTMAAAEEIIRKLKPKSFRTSALIIKQGARYIPNYYVAKTDKGVWLEFPWED